MTGTLNVKPSELRSAANTFDNTGRSIQSLTRNMTNIVNQMSGRVWSGDAANTYKSKFNGLQDDINRMVNMISEHVTDLNNMARQYESAEAQNQQLARTLSENVIS